MAMKPARIVETSFNPETALAYEGLFTIGSGYLHIRGSLEEHLSNAPQNIPYMRMPGNVSAEKFGGVCAKWGTYVPGVFGKHPLLNREMVNLPWFLDLAPVSGGERLDMRTSRIRDYRRELDLRTATLSRSLTWLPRNGPPVRVHFERFISAVRPNLCVQRLTLTPERRVAIKIVAGIDGDVLTSGYDHLTHVAVKRAGKNGLTSNTVTDSGDKVRIVSRLSPVNASWRFKGGKRSGQLAAVFTVKAGDEIVIEKRTAVSTSRDLVKCSAESLLSGAAALSFEQLHAEHEAVWKKRWAGADVEIDERRITRRHERCDLSFAEMPRSEGFPRRR